MPLILILPSSFTNPSEPTREHVKVRESDTSPLFPSPQEFSPPSDTSSGHSKEGREGRGGKEFQAPCVGMREKGRGEDKRRGRRRGG